MADFDFVHEYRSLQPLADAATIAGRQASFDAIKTDVSKNAVRASDLVRLAFKLPYLDTSESDSWFTQHMRVHNSSFSLDHDREEAANISTLLLKARIEAGLLRTILLVITAGFGGRRPSVDRGMLLQGAKSALAKQVRRVGQGPAIAKIKTYKLPDLSAQIAGFDGQTGDAPTKTLIDAMSNVYLGSINNVAQEANDAIAKLAGENARLSNEVNILWWHIGGHSLLLDVPLDTVSEKAKPFVIAADVATIVGSLPGPYGSYGVIRKALGSNADEPIKLSDAFKALSDSGMSLLATRRVDKDFALVPIHTAISAALIDGSPLSGAQFKKLTDISMETKLTHYELALQLYHERLLISDSLAQ